MSVDRDTTEDQEFLTVTEVAELLQVPPGTVKWWTYQGLGPQSFKVGRHRRWRRSVVLRWISDQEQAVAS
jgi:prophage regulatory protein